MDDDDRAFEAARDEGLGDETEELAATEEALAEERDERDAAASEEVTDPREEYHGNALAWWLDTSLLDAFTVMAEVIAEVEQQHGHAEMLVEEGVPAETMTSTLSVNFRTGPVIFGALQLFGLWAPELRDTCAELIAALQPPEPTEEETAAIEAAYARIEEKMAEERERQAEEFQRMMAEQEQDALDNVELGLDPN